MSTARARIIRWIGLCLSIIAAGGLLVVSIVSGTPELHHSHLYQLGAAASTLSIPGFSASVLARLRYGSDRVTLAGISLGVIVMLYLPTVWLPFLQHRN